MSTKKGYRNSFLPNLSKLGGEFPLFGEIIITFEKFILNQAFFLKS